jgi:hypothetical protein
MVEYLTRDSLRGRVLVNEQATVRKAQERSPSGSTFLSHSTKDAEVLPRVISLLEEHGAAVYVDKKDEALPPYTSSETAEILKDRIRQSRKFILLTSRNSKDSRWMPWELGIADGYKNPANTAILPTLDQADDRAWSEQEYLGICDRIVYGRFVKDPRPVYMVWNHKKQTGLEFSAWLKK